MQGAPTHREQLPHDHPPGEDVAGGGGWLAIQDLRRLQTGRGMGWVWGPVGPGMQNHAGRAARGAARSALRNQRGTLGCLWSALHTYRPSHQPARVHVGDSRPTAARVLHNLPRARRGKGGRAGGRSGEQEQPGEAALTGRGIERPGTAGGAVGDYLNPTTPKTLNAPGLQGAGRGGMRSVARWAGQLLAPLLNPVRHIYLGQIEVCGGRGHRAEA